MGTIFPEVQNDSSLFLYFGNIINQVKLNLYHLGIYNVAHPFLLMFTMPCIFALLNWKDKDKFIRASVIFAFILFIPYFLLAYFREVRAETMILVLLLPSALMSLKKLIGGSKDTRK